ncbi:LysE family transporter [Burkholderia cenocepacia]|jgi:threonine/homoserine/homoserine lactone efflux protein|uniref:LysE family translocator n=1 Tax=Burkholderia cenocepacia TaxID=95486 RepID=UPI0012126B24|nr:LysE family transporter [Burkholderia cenocepacia]MBR8393958.1 LysE family transporter [Burkholderia cenocepacia]TAM55475.1 MAG: lysine transporter LysE [Paraburkholderia sp.]
MNYIPQFSAVAGVMLLACVSPGPDLIAVTSHALAKRRTGLFAAAGIATSHALWAALAIFGLGLILAKLAWLYEAIRITGAVYLLYLGGKTLAGLRKSVKQAEVSAQLVKSDRQAYRRGLFVGLTNPKGAAFFGSLFVTVLPAHAPMWVYGATLAIVTVVSLSWFSAMAILFSTSRVQVGYVRLRKPIDAVLGTVLLGLGVKLAVDR